MTRKRTKATAAVGAVAVLGLLAIAVPAIADAASPSPNTSTPASPAAPDPRGGLRHLGNEKELTGATADRVKAAVLAELPGATVQRMSAEDPREGTGAAYEAHVTRSDGTRLQVLLDRSFTVTAVNAGRGRSCHHGRGMPPGGGESSTNPTVYNS
ncbi:MAG: hypothetical protein ACR2J0_01910 [Mycobacteriales bacterium]